jgi:glycosyltransferase involved in cell wall biosynthesis
MPRHPERPRIAVVIPTYNRVSLLRGTLDALVAQRLPATDFEVVVSDDGSTDTTRQVVAAFADRLRMRYHFQEDLGFRAAAARTAGSRLTSAPVLAFIDTGVLPGPDFLSAHLAAHLTGPPAAVAGYTYGYRPGHPTPGLADAVRTMPPQEVVRSYGDSPDFWDIRHLAYARFRFDLDNSAVPWLLFWSVNCSVRAADFQAAGGFDEGFVGWGGEDLELGFRLFRHGLRFAVDRDAWAVDTPHPRRTADDVSNKANILKFLHKHPEPVVELLWCWFMRDRPWFEGGHEWHVEDEYRALIAAAETTRTVDVTGELAQLRHVPAGTRIAVFGCGAQLPDCLPHAALFDFDPQIVASAHHPVQHVLGLRTTLPDASVDLVFITSRLRGLWDRWGSTILAEADRIGGHVSGPLPGCAPPIAAGQKR